MTKHLIKATHILANSLIIFFSFQVYAELAPASVPSRVCEIHGKGGKKLTIVAGPDLTSSSATELASEFPESVPCSSESGQCSKWNYRYIWSGMNPSLAYVDMSSDLALNSIDNGGNFSSAGTGDSQSDSGINNYDVRWIKWSANQATFDASFLTPSATPRISSAGGKSGNFEGFCAILGAGIEQENGSYAQDTLVAEKIVRSGDGSKICTKVNPTTQCETGIDCETGDELPGIPLEDLIEANNLQVTHVSVPGQQCPTFVTYDSLPDTRYYCSGGVCYVF